MAEINLVHCVQNRTVNALVLAGSDRVGTGNRVATTGNMSVMSSFTPDFRLREWERPDDGRPPIGLAEKTSSPATLSYQRIPQSPRQAGLRRTKSARFGPQSHTPPTRQAAHTAAWSVRGSHSAWWSSRGRG